jgi:glycosyltransferase involved in cell wall biosynthesis
VLNLTLLIPTLDRSGAEKQLTLLATHLPRDEFAVNVLTLDRAGPYGDVLRDHGIGVSVLGKRRKFDPRVFGRLRAQLESTRCDILHTWLFSANAYGRLLRRRPAGMRIAVSERCVDSWKQGWQLWLDRRLIPRTDRLIANSNSVADFYAGVGYPRDRISVIPNAVESPAPSRIDRAAFLKQNALPADARLVCHVGRLAPQKRVDDLLWAAQVLRQAEPRAYFLIIGDGPERARLEQHARDVECSAHVRFLGHREDATGLMQLCDVFWLGSSFEGMSNSLMEAMACRLPVVASDIPPNRELIIHGEHGYLVPVGDGAAFAQYTVRLLGQPDLAGTFGDAGRARIGTGFTVQKMVDRHMELYRSVTCGGRPM